MSAPLRYFVVDAFTARPFAGNPAAVVLLERWPDDAWLQNVALEFNLSETAYLVPNAAGYHLRWFTPKVEVDLCGHATLASAVALARLEKLADGATVLFSTRSGILPVVRQGPRYQLDFPKRPAVAAAPPPGLIESLGAAPQYVGRNDFDYLLEVESETELRQLAPNFRDLAAVKCRGVIVTATSDNPQFDFVSRFFAPAAGIDEDPVTGSAHCCLADYWSKRLGKPALVGYQVSARGGVVQVEVRGDRVLLGGEGVIVAEGQLACY
jgi:predicted PhzF superfamily epimerase YddE/YHI9